MPHPYESEIIAITPLIIRRIAVAQNIRLHGQSSIRLVRPGPHLIDDYLVTAGRDRAHNPRSLSRGVREADLSHIAAVPIGSGTCQKGGIFMT
jgi:hypothetical protein